ncbi:hypothetical protein pb186bvf_019712 [Paramecium bursaria]
MISFMLSLNKENKIYLRGYSDLYIVLFIFIFIIPFIFIISISIYSFYFEFQIVQHHMTNLEVQFQLYCTFCKQDFTKFTRFQISE